MRTAYLVHVRSGAGKDAGDTLHVIADGPDEAAAAVRAAVEPDAIVEAESEPLAGERVGQAGAISGKVLIPSRFADDW